MKHVSRVTDKSTAICGRKKVASSFSRNFNSTRDTCVRVTNERVKSRKLSGCWSAVRSEMKSWNKGRYRYFAAWGACPASARFRLSTATFFHLGPRRHIDARQRWQWIKISPAPPREFAHDRTTEALELTFDHLSRESSSLILCVLLFEIHGSQPEGLPKADQLRLVGFQVSMQGIRRSCNEKKRRPFLLFFKNWIDDVANPFF